MSPRRAAAFIVGLAILLAIFQNVVSQEFGEEQDKNKLVDDRFRSNAKSTRYALRGRQRRRGDAWAFDSAADDWGYDPSYHSNGGHLDLIGSSLLVGRRRYPDAGLRDQDAGLQDQDAGLQNQQQQQQQRYAWRSAKLAEDGEHPDGNVV